MGQGRNWTQEEKQYLEENWGSKSIGTLQKNLNRNRNAILIMVQRLKLGPFLDNGDYVTWNQLQKVIGLGNSGSGYKMKSWVENRGFPLHTKRVGSNSFKIVYINEFWEWAEKNMSFLDFSNFERNSLGAEPEWVPIKRKKDIDRNSKYITTPWTVIEDKKLERMVKKQQYSYHEISVELRRTVGAIQRRLGDLEIMDRPIKADNHNPWTEREFETVKGLIVKGFSYELIAEHIGRSSKAIRGKIGRELGTENLDKVRVILSEKCKGVS